MKFTKHVRFRKEKDCIFLCDCKRLKDFKVPLEYWNILLKLKIGLRNKNLSDKESLLIADFNKAGLIEG